MGMTTNMILASRAAQKGLMTAGDVVMMQTLMLQLLNPLFFLGVMYRNFTDNFLDIIRLYEVLEMVPKVREPEKPLECGELAGEIEFRRVSFCYPNQSVNFIRELSFDIKPKEFVAIMGPSGIGKSTIFNLMFRLYDPKEGEVLLDGKNVKDLRLVDFRSQIGFVSQAPYLFNDSVLNNILYGNPNATV
jgi:ABC-type multidrug transport system fused ATPase/permease subunit